MERLHEGSGIAVALERETCPVVGLRPAFGASHRLLGFAQGGSREHAALEQGAVEGFHQDGGRPVVDRPQADQDLRRPGVDKGLG